MSVRCVSVVLGAAIAVGACARSRTVSDDGGPLPDRPVGTGSDAPTTMTPPPPPPPTGDCVQPAPVDLLFVIDNSNSMIEEQDSLGVQLPHLLDMLVSPPDSDFDGVADWLPISSIHVGVVTTDMGTGGFVVPTCAEPNFGDDGVLRTRGNTARPGCAPTYPPFVDYRAGADLMLAANDLSCVAMTGTGGCGFEQQLEAALKTITPSTSGIRFSMGTLGHGDTENAGFLRSESMLAVVILSDEEDCSVADPELFNPDSGIYPGDLNLRCFQYPGAVTPISRYADGLLALRSTRPDLLAFGVVSGVPARLDYYPPDFDAILADPEMQEVIDPAMPTRLTPSCNLPGRGIAFPPRRMVMVGKELAARGASVAIGSICQEDLSFDVDTIGRMIGERACLRYESP